MSDIRIEPPDDAPGVPAAPVFASATSPFKPPLLLPEYDDSTKLPNPANQRNSIVALRDVGDGNHGIGISDGNQWFLKSATSLLTAGLPTSGTVFPLSPPDGHPFYRTDLVEQFHYVDSITAWVGELRSDGMGTSGSITNGSYTRRYNGMTLSSSRGIGPTPYNIVLTEIEFNWSTSASGDFTLRRSGVSVHAMTVTVATTHSELGLLVPIDSGGILAITNNTGVTVSAIQFAFKYRRRIDV